MDIATVKQRQQAAWAAGDTTRQAAVEGFEDLFSPANIVDLATGQVPER